MTRTKVELEQTKSKQALYYDRGSKSLPELKVGDIVRMLPKKGEKMWAKAKVTMEVSPRSYIVTTGDGVKYRRNRRHLRRTLEPDMELEETDVDLPLINGNEEHTDEKQSVVDSHAAAQPESNPLPSLIAAATRAPRRRHTRRPAYLQDYVTD